MEPQYKNWLTDIFRQILMWIDLGIYGLVRFVIQGIFDLANLTTSAEMVNGIYMRIYVLLGVFMVFKLSFSFFTYIVDPESMTNGKEKGVGKLIANTIVMLAMLVSLPTILFGNVNGEPGLINRAQTALLPMLPRILLGIESGTGVSSGDEGAVAQAADTMAAAALMPFFSPAEGISSVCSEYASVEVPPIKSLSDFQEFGLLSCNNSGGGVPIVGYFTASGLYVYHYSYGLSTVVGIIMLVILAGITIDVGKRVFKLLILQMIAPVPIMSYIDPKSSKDGAFAGWLKNLITTFLDLFLKLGLVYLILMFIEAIVVNKTMFTNFPEMTDIRAYYLILILIIALLMFAKEAPKFIKDSLGIKGKDASKSALGSLFGKTAGMVGGGLAGAASGFVSGGFGGMLTGAAAGAGAGFAGAGTGKPSGAWKAGGNAALQAKTGDPKAQAGIFNNLARRASDRQMRGIAEKYGVTDTAAEQLKNQMYSAQSESADAERMANAVMQDKSSTKQQRDYYNALANEKKTAAAKAESAYKETSQYAKTYRSSQNDYETLKGYHYKAAKLINKYQEPEIGPTKSPDPFNEADFMEAQRKAGVIGTDFVPYGETPLTPPQQGPQQPPAGGPTGGNNQPPRP